MVDEAGTPPSKYYRDLGQHKHSRVAQAVEQAPEEGRVAGSNPALGTLSTSGGKGRR